MVDALWHLASQDADDDLCLGRLELLDGSSEGGLVACLSGFGSRLGEPAKMICDLLDNLTVPGLSQLL